MFSLKKVKMAVFVTLLLLMLAACDEEDVVGGEIKEWLESLNRLKFHAEEQAEVIPYGKVQYEIFKNYFSKINNIILSLRDNEKMAMAFRAAVEQKDLSDICSKAFLKRSTWEKMMQGCQHERFFLCSEEVKNYPESISVFQKYLSFEQQKKFNEIETCRGVQ